jgi:hypothetical protein
LQPQSPLLKLPHPLLQPQPPLRKLPHELLQPQPLRPLPQELQPHDLQPQELLRLHGQELLLKLVLLLLHQELQNIFFSPWFELALANTVYEYIFHCVHRCDCVDL